MLYIGAVGVHKRFTFPGSSRQRFLSSRGHAATGKDDVFGAWDVSGFLVQSFINLDFSFIVVSLGKLYIRRNQPTSRQKKR